MIWFADQVLHEPLDPWQQWVVIHLGELLPDGRPRFRQVLILVARQNGKTHLCKVLALFWLFVERQALVFGTSTNLEQAKEAWEAAVESAQACSALAARIPKRGVRIGNGQQTLSTTDRCRYKIGAADRRGGRGKTIRRQIGDELREHHTWEAYRAANFAMNAVNDAQAVYISNMGDDKSVVLNALRDSALEAVDDSLGIFEWSAKPGSHPSDTAGWAAANPQLRRRMDPAVLAGAAARVSKPGADPQELAGFLTEALCMQVARLNPALDPAGWAEGNQPAPVDLAARDQMAVCFDLAWSGRHATVAVAQHAGEGKVRVETVAEWTGPAAAAELERELPDWIRRVRPKVVGWFPSGPAAAVAAKLADRSKQGVRGWPPRGVRIEPIKGELTAACMGLGKEVDARTLLHSGQAMLDAQVGAAEPAPRGDGWVFMRRGVGDVDAVYAIAGAVHLVRTLPVGLGKPRFIRPRETPTG